LKKFFEKKLDKTLRQLYIRYIYSNDTCDYDFGKETSLRGMEKVEGEKKEPNMQEQRGQATTRLLIWIILLILIMLFFIG